MSEVVEESVSMAEEMQPVEKMPVLRVTEEGRNESQDIVVREYPLTVAVNDREIVTLLCSPADLEYLAVGYLFSEGVLDDRGQIESVVFEESRATVRVEARVDMKVNGGAPAKPLIASGGARIVGRQDAAARQGQPGAEAGLLVSPNQVFELVSRFQQYSELHERTHGVHSAALCDARDILVFHEDIGRHNAIDKVLGHCIMENIPVHDRIMIISGRVSSEMLLKAARRAIPMMVSISAPTNMGVKLARDEGMTLVGFARDNRMNVYSGSWRISG